jgi:hypothetical protein
MIKLVNMIDHIKKEDQAQIGLFLEVEVRVLKINIENDFFLFGCFNFIYFIIILFINLILFIY